MQADSVAMDQVSGPRLHVEAVFKGFKKRGHQVRMVAIQNNKTQWTDDLESWHLGEFGFSESKVFRLFESIVRGIQSRLHLPFFRLFDGYRYSDICISALSGFDILYQRDGTMSYGGIIAARRLGIPFVLEVNGDLIEEWTLMGLKFPRLQWAVVRRITRQIYQHASLIIAVGETIRQHLIQRWGLDPSRILVVTNGANIELFQNGHAIRTPSRFLHNGGEYIVFVGGFQPWHGIELILDAFCRIVCVRPEARLILAGDGPLLLAMQDRALSLNLQERVIFTGSVDQSEVSRLLYAASVAVIYHCGSAAEIVETPLKLFEYMAAGKAIVAPAVPNMKRILTDRVNALLVPPDNPEALAAAFIELLEDEQLRADLGSEALKDAIERHSWDRVVRELETILFHLLESTTNKTYEVDSISGQVSM